MKSLENAQVTKGMLFAGCSFTWGQGLYYYSNLPTIQEPPPDQYNPEYVTDAHKEFMASRRYPRLVANHFNSFEFVHPRNGGSNESAVAYWRGCFENDNPDARIYNDIIRPLKYEEISHVVFQLTQWQRDNFWLEAYGQKYHIPFHCTGQDQYKNYFLKYLDDQNLSMDSWIEKYIQDGLDNVKNFLQTCESHGVKTILFTWPSEYLRFIEKDPWLKERLMNFKYDGKLYRSIEDLMYPGTMHNAGYNPELTIKWDAANFADTPKDHHPSLKCHQVMAQNIIEKIESLSNESSF